MGDYLIIMGDYSLFRYGYWVLPSCDHLKAKPNLGDIGEEGKDDGEVEVVSRGAHVNLVWRAWTRG